MKVKGRTQSSNIEDRRSYFGSDSLYPDYTDEQKKRDFLFDTLHNPKPDAPQKFKKLTLEDIITEAINGR